MANRTERRRPGQLTTSGVKLAREQYSELNGTFYNSDPASYFRSRLQALLLLSSGSDMVDDALRDGASLPGFQIGPMSRPNAEQRMQFAQMDGTVLLHHSAETLLRLFITHRGESRCPWLQLAKLRDDFRAQVVRLAKDGFTRDDLAKVFMGGMNLDESGIDLSDQGWDEAIDGLEALMRSAADRWLNQSKLYNAAKHGLVGAYSPTETLTVGSREDDGESVSMYEGAGIVFLDCDNSKRQEKWKAENWVAIEDKVDPREDVMMTALITRGIHSLWAVARRQFAGYAGELLLIERDEVEVASSLGVLMSGVPGVRNEYTLPVVQLDDKDEWRLRPTEMRATIVDPGDKTIAAYGRFLDGSVPIKTVALPLRARDIRPKASHGRHLFAFSPRGSEDPGLGHLKTHAGDGRQ